MNKLLILANKNYNVDEIKNINYGFSILWLSITKLFPLTLIAILCDFLGHFYLMLACYGLIKLFSFGAHASNSWKCLILSTIFLLIPSMILKHFIIPFPLALFINFLCLPAFFLWAPAATIKRPIIKKRKLFKILSMIIALIYLLIVFLELKYYSFFTFSCLIQIAVVSPILNKRKLFKGGDKI